MTFAAIDESRHDGQPLELYYFRYGSDAAAFLAYNNGEKDFDYAGDTYVPLPIQRGQVVSSGTLDKSQMKVAVPMNSDIAELFRAYPPGQVVTLTIRAGHINDPDGEFPVVWVGRVLSGARATGFGDDQRKVELNCEPSSTSMRRSGLRRHYQLTCPHVLYGDKCQADKAAATVTGTISALTYNTITLTTGWNLTFGAKKFVGGLVEWDGAALRERRSIMRVDTNVLTLAGPTTGLAVTDTVDVVLGCNHQAGATGDCAALHDNILNFGGFPYIPQQNPVHTNPFA